MAAIAFFSKKMSTAQQKYSAYDIELLAIYEAVKHFRHMQEARHFVIFTGHKPLIYARDAISAPHDSSTTLTTSPSSQRTSATSLGKTMWSPMLYLTWRHSARQSHPKLWPKRRQQTQISAPFCEVPPPSG